MIFNTNKDKGRAGLSLAIAYFGSNGYTVSLPLNDTQDYDLIVDKEGTLSKVSVKSTGQKKDNGNYICKLASYSASSSKMCGTVKNSSADLLFCLCEDGTMYLIPVSEITTTQQITLQKTRSSKANKNTLDTSKYIVTI